MRSSARTFEVVVEMRKELNEGLATVARAQSRGILLSITLLVITCLKAWTPAEGIGTHIAVQEEFKLQFPKTQCIDKE